jgi:hypothetical protein
MFRNVELTEWLWWGGSAAALILLGLVLNQLNRERSKQRARKFENRERWSRLVSPLAGGSVWGSRKPPLALRVGLLYLGVMALSILHNPIFGLLLIAWALTLWVSVILENNRRKSEDRRNTGR